LLWNVLAQCKEQGDAGYAHSTDPNRRSTLSATFLLKTRSTPTAATNHTAVPSGTVSKSDLCLREIRPGRGSSGSPPRIPKRFANTCFPFWMLRSSSRDQSTQSVCTPTRWWYGNLGSSERFAPWPACGGSPTSTHRLRKWVCSVGPGKSWLKSLARPSPRSKAGPPKKAKEGRLDRVSAITPLRRFVGIARIANASFHERASAVFRQVTVSARYRRFERNSESATIQSHSYC